MAFGLTIIFFLCAFAPLTLFYKAIHGARITNSYTNIFKRVSKSLIAVVLLYRRIRFGYPFRKLRLAQPKYALIDERDYERFSKYQWTTKKDGKNFYIIRYYKDKHNGKNRMMRMHHEIIKPGEGMVIDHINKNGIDNRRENLRQATYAQNICNRNKISTPTTSRHKGVYFDRTAKKFRAQICINRRKKHLGYFLNETEAAKAYDKAAKKLHKEFASLNFKS